MKFMNWKLFLILFVASMLSVIAVLPYTLTLQAPLLKDLPIPLYIILSAQIVQNAVLFAVFIVVGLYASKKVGLCIPVLEGFLEGKEVKSHLLSILPLSLVSGAVVGGLIIGFDSLFYYLNPEPFAGSAQVNPPVWQAFLASFYGGIGEEVAMRLFLMTVLVWIFFKAKRTAEGNPTTFGVWLAIILAAVLFGIGHLPFTSALVQISPFIVARAIILNGIAGVVFGWLYWKKGLESAMISHFSADIVLHVLFPLFS